jgi:hypothetical protein
MATEPVIRGRTGEMTVAAVVQALVDVLGEALVAMTAGVDDAQIVRQWGRGERIPPTPVQVRLRTAMQIVQLLLDGARAGAGRAPRGSSGSCAQLPGRVSAGPPVRADATRGPVPHRAWARSTGLAALGVRRGRPFRRSPSRASGTLRRAPAARRLRREPGALPSPARCPGSATDDTPAGRAAARRSRPGRLVQPPCYRAITPEAGPALARPARTCYSRGAPDRTGAYVIDAGLAGLRSKRCGWP